MVSDGDFSKAPGGQDLTKLKSQYSMFVDALDSKQMTVSIVTYG